MHSTDLSEFHMDPRPQTVPIGGAARFECQIKGVPTPVITWEKDQAPVPQDTRWDYYVDSLRENITFYYIYWKHNVHFQACCG